MSFQVTEGSGKTIASDVFGAAHNVSSGEQVQFVALATGTLGALALATAANPVPVAVGIGGTASPGGAGAVSGSTPRTTLASDDPAVTSLQLLSAAVVVDDAPFTVATTKTHVAGFFANETATDSVNEGDIGAARITLDRKQVVSVYSHTAGGATPYQLLSAASTNATSIKGSAGQVYGIQVNNLNAAVRYLKLYDKASAPTVGTDTPVKTIAIPPSASVVVPVPACGLAFSNGIAFALTTGIAVTDTGAVAANEHAVCIDYK